MTRVSQKATRAKDAKTVAVFNVKFSENLGDGMIAETIEEGLLCQKGIRRVVTKDLAGRQAYGAQSIRGRKNKMQVLGMMPGIMRRAVVKKALAGRIASLRDDWSQTIARADHVVIGGGHLFQDDDLNFPSKIGALLEICSDQKVPVSVYAVGVTDCWSAQAKELFGQLSSCRVVSVSVRDRNSQRNWAQHFLGTDIQDAAINLDPVLSLPAPALPVERKAIGLCITHSRLIAHHAGTLPPNLLDFFVETTQRLCDLGHSVVLFTNGAEEDEEALGSVASHDAVARLISEGIVSTAEKPRTPPELVALIGGMRGLVAHRLHANIVAFSSGIPSVGLGWDRKVESFFNITSRMKHFIPFDRVESSEAVECLKAALDEGIDPGMRENVRSMAAKGLSDLAQNIISGGTPRPANIAVRPGEKVLNAK